MVSFESSVGPLMDLISSTQHFLNIKRRIEKVETNKNSKLLHSVLLGGLGVSTQEKA